MKKILIIGSVDNEYGFLYSLVSNVKNQNPDIEFDIFQMGYNEIDDVQNCFDSIFYNKENFPKIFYKIKFFFRVLDIIINFFKIKKRYDIVNFHYLSYYSVLIATIFWYRFGYVVLSPWGSDIYRERKLTLFKKNIFQKANYITVFNDNPLKNEVISYLDIKDNSKFFDVGFGSNVLEKIAEYKAHKEKIKLELDLADKFVITCGYNGKPEQNHIKILASIKNVKDKLPKNTLFTLPMSYGMNENYKKEVENFLNEAGLEYIIFDKFMSVDYLAMLRVSSDIFIHAQTTDAFSASVQEHIFAGTNVINASWVRYQGLEKYGVPYVLFDSFKDLEQALVDIIKGNLNCEVTDQLLQEISERRWSVVAKKWGSFYKHLISESV